MRPEAQLIGANSRNGAFSLPWEEEGNLFPQSRKLFWLLAGHQRFARGTVSVATVRGKAARSDFLRYEYPRSSTPSFGAWSLSMGRAQAPSVALDVACCSARWSRCSVPGNVSLVGFCTPYA